MGDTQEHESTGYPMHDNDSAVDAYVEVAQRPPEQPLFGRRVMEWALQRAPDRALHAPGRRDGPVVPRRGRRMTKIFRAAGRSRAPSCPATTTG
jgi:hypothetical protein